jgi:hypothetical protein
MNKGTCGSLLSCIGIIGIGMVVEFPFEQKLTVTGSVILLDRKDE